MKKSLKILVFTLVAVTVLAFSATALAAEYDHCADALKAMGLFQGGANGYELDRQATRAEAAVMLVRLLGAEQEALTGEFSHPFTDVPDWASPYIAYMYDTGLTKGVSATSFNPQGICDLRMYSAFVLRALGYEDDFTYAEATEFAMQLGVVDILTGSGDFKRDQLAAISYTALFTPSKGSEDMLLTQLIENGVVDESAAQPYLQLFADYALIQAANLNTSELGQTPAELKIDMTMTMDMGAEGAMDMKLDSLMQIDASAVANADQVEQVLAALDKIKFAMTNKIAITVPETDKMDVVLDLYLLDGVAYINTNLGELMEVAEIPAQMQVDVNTVLAMAGMSGLDLSSALDMNGLMSTIMPGDPYAPHYGFAHIKTIKSTATATGGKRLDVSIINISNDLMQSLVSMIYGGMPEISEAMEELQMNYDINDYSYTLDKDNNLQAMTMGLDMTQVMLPGTPDEMTVRTKMQINMEITKTGKDVKITLPGKAADYVDLMTLMGGAQEPAL